ncbi:uncharacterized protein [Canis lupus baileyi]|uniref:uncharacterized protein isoform X11 n=1 Tax=Canis lupus baileyi TaxID=143281 RepID=UPI003B9721F3
MNLDNISVVEIIWAPEQLIQKDKTFTRCNLTAQKMNKCFPNFVLFLLGLLILPEAISRGLWRCNETPGHLHPDVYSSNVHNSQTVEGASVSIER